MAGGDLMRGRHKKPTVAGPEFRHIPGHPVPPADVAKDPATMAHWDRLCLELSLSGTLGRQHADIVALIARKSRRAEVLNAVFLRLEVVDEIRMIGAQLGELENSIAQLLKEMGLTGLSAPEANANIARAGAVTPLEEAMTAFLQ